MQTVINVVLPVFAIIAAGYLCGQRKLLGADASAALNQFVYWVALPAMLFKSMAEIDIGTIWNIKFIAGFITPIIILWLAAIALAVGVFKLNMSQAALHGMNGIYGNSGYLGIPLAIIAFGQAAAVPAIIITVINTALVVAAAICLIEWNQKSGMAMGALVWKVGSALVRNPMLVAPFAGLACSAAGWTMPTAITTFTGLLGAAAGSCALFAIGLFMVGKPSSDSHAEVAMMTVTKLLIHPLLTALVLVVLFPANPLWAKVAILMAALPTGTGSFVLAQAYSQYILRTSSAILVTTILSVGTLSMFFYVFPPGAQ